MGTDSDRYLVACAYCIVLLDFLSALLFAIISVLMFSKNGNWSALVVLFFTIFWIIIVIVLAAGIIRRKNNLVRFWLVFTCLGLILDSCILLYGLTLAIAMNWEGVKITVLPFVGLAVEMTFVYIIYLFYPYLEKQAAYAQENEQCSRSTAGCVMKVVDEVEEKGGEEVEEQVEEKPMDRKELKRLQRMAKERMKKDKAAIKELQKQMRRNT